MSVKVGEFDDGSPINTIMVSELIAQLQKFPQHLPVIARIITPESNNEEEVETLVAPFIGIDTDSIDHWVEGAANLDVVSLAVPIPGNIVEIDDEDDEDNDEDLDEVDEDESEDETTEEDDEDLTEDEDDEDKDENEDDEDKDEDED